MPLPETIRAQVGDLTVYDISLFMEGKRTHFDFSPPVMIDIPIPFGACSHRLVAIYIDSDGQVHILPGLAIGQTMRFTTKHLSYYGLMEVKESFAKWRTTGAG